MSLTPFLSLTPSNPYALNYDPANPNAPYAIGNLFSYGGFTDFTGPATLKEQFTHDELVVGYNPVPVFNQTVHSINDFYGKSTIRAYIGGYNIPTDSQYLLLAQ